MFFGLFLLAAFIVCLMAAIGLGAIGVVLFAIILYQPFRLLEFVPRRQMRFWLSIALAVVLWVAFATMFGDGGLKDYIGSAGVVGISLVSFWLIGLDPEPEDEQPKTGEGDTVDNPVGQAEGGGSLPVVVQSDTSSEDACEAEGATPGNDSTDKHAPKPHVSGPDVVGPGLFVELEFLGNRIEISTCARQLMEFRNGAVSIIEPFAEQIADQTKWLRGPGGGHWIDLCHDNLTSCPDVLRRSLDFFQDCCAARGVFDIGDRSLEDGGLPDPRELSTIAMEAIGRAQSRTGCALVHWDPGLIRMCQGAGGTASASGASEASAEDSPLFATSIGEIKTAAWAARDADLAYKQVVKRLDGQEFCEMDRTMREIGMREYYLPTLAFLSHWQEGLITAYMHELGIRGQFDLDPLMDFSTDRSDAMLANLSRATDTRELLVQAFVACPYNEDVYIKADELGLLDGEGYRSARYFGFGPLLPNATEAQFATFLDEPVPYGRGAGGSRIERPASDNRYTDEANSALEPEDADGEGDAEAKGEPDEVEPAPRGSALDEAEAVRRAIFEATQDYDMTYGDMDE